MRLTLISLIFIFSSIVALTGCGSTRTDVKKEAVTEAEKLELEKLQMELNAVSTKMSRIVGNRLGVPPAQIIVCHPDPELGACTNLIKGCVTFTGPDGRQYSYQDPPAISCQGPCPCQ